MKLFRVDIIDGCEPDSILVVAKDKEWAENKVASRDWSCLMYCSATEIDEVDGFKIKLENNAELKED